MKHIGHHCVSGNGKPVRQISMFSWSTEHTFKCIDHYSLIHLEMDCFRIQLPQLNVSVDHNSYVYVYVSEIFHLFQILCVCAKSAH